MRFAIFLFCLFCASGMASSLPAGAQPRDPFFRQAFLVPDARNVLAPPNSYLEARVESFNFGAGSDLISNEFRDILRRIFRTDSGSVALTVKVSVGGVSSGTQILSTFNLADKNLTRLVEFNRPILAPTLLQSGDNVRFEFRVIRLRQSLPSEIQRLLSGFADLPVGPWVRAFQTFGDTFIDTYRDLTANPQNADDTAIYNLSVSNLNSDQRLYLTRYGGSPVAAQIDRFDESLARDIAAKNVDHLVVRLRTVTEVLTPANTLAENSRMGPALGLVVTPYLTRARQTSSAEDKFLECSRMRSHLRTMAMLSDIDIVNVVADAMATAQFDPNVRLGNQEPNRYQCLSPEELSDLRARHAFSLGSCQSTCASALDFLSQWKYGSASARYNAVRWFLPEPGAGSFAQMSQQWMLVNFGPLRRDDGGGPQTTAYRTVACLYSVQARSQSLVDLSIETDPAQGRAFLQAANMPATGPRPTGLNC